MEQQINLSLSLKSITKIKDIYEHIHKSEHKIPVTLKQNLFNFLKSFFFCSVSFCHPSEPAYWQQATVAENRVRHKLHHCKNHYFFKSSPEDMFLNFFREREWEGRREREREKNISCFPFQPWCGAGGAEGWNLPPRYVPCPQVDLATFPCMGGHSNQLNPLARAI